MNSQMVHNDWYGMVGITYSTALLGSRSETRLPREVRKMAGKGDWVGSTKWDRSIISRHCATILLQQRCSVPQRVLEYGTAL